MEILQYVSKQFRIGSGYKLILVNIFVLLSHKPEFVFSTWF